MTQLQIIVTPILQTIITVITIISLEVIPTVSSIFYVTDYQFKSICFIALGY